MFRGNDFDGNDLGKVEGGGDGDDSTHSSSSSSVCHPGVAITITVFMAVLIVVYRPDVD